MLAKLLNLCIKAELLTKSVDNFVDKKNIPPDSYYKYSVSVRLDVS